MLSGLIPSWSDSARTFIVSRTYDFPYSVTVFRDYSSLDVYYRHVHHIHSQTLHDYLLGPGFQPYWIISPPSLLVIPSRSISGLTGRVSLNSEIFNDHFTLLPDRSPRIRYSFTWTDGRVFRWKKPSFSASLKCDFFPSSTLHSGPQRESVLTFDASETALHVCHQRLSNCAEDMIGLLSYPVQGLLHREWSEKLESALVATAIVVLEASRGERRLPLLT